VFVTPRALPTRTRSVPDRALAAQQGLSAIKAAIDAQASQSSQSPSPPPPPPPGASAMSRGEKADDEDESADEDGAPMTVAETLSLSAEVARANSPQPTSGFRRGVSPLLLERMRDDATSTAVVREGEAGASDESCAARQTEAEAEAGEDRDATEEASSPPSRRARPDQATAAAAAAAAREAQEAEATQSSPQLTPLVATEQGVTSPFTPLAAPPLFGSPLGSERSHRGPYKGSPQVPCLSLPCSPQPQAGGQGYLFDPQRCT